MDKQMLLFDAEVVRGKLADCATPGFAPEFDPYEAQAAGAFVEYALSEAEARESCADVFSLELFRD